MLPQIRRFLSSRKLLVPLILSAALVPGTALADTKEATVVGILTPQLVVQSNGSGYHSVSGFANLVASVRAQVDTGTVGRVKSWKIWIGLSSEDGDQQSYESYNFAKSYPWYDRPASVDRTEQIIVASAAWSGFVKARCNALADDLRGQGLGDTAIFGQDRTLELAVVPVISADTTGAGSGNIIEEGKSWESHAKIDLVCEKWSGSAIPQASDNITTAPAKVVNKGLSIYELATLNGTCKIRLDGWITTDHKGANVSFRYRNQEGKQSQVWTVNTGDNKTATFSHWYDIANNFDPETGIDWAESGFVRMVGVSHDFKSDWAEYTMECVEGGPDTLTSNDPPSLAVSVVPQGKVMVHGRICPERLKLVGVLEGRGNFSGQAVFFGPGYISPLRDYTITHGQKVLIGADAVLDWDDVPAPPIANAPLAQMREFAFNVTNENSAIIASLPKRSYIFECRLPQVIPGVQHNSDALAVETRNPVPSGADAAKPSRLQPRTSEAAPQRGAPQRLLPRRPAPPTTAPTRLQRQTN